MSKQIIAHTVKQRDLRVHPYLWTAAGRALERGKAEPVGSFYEFMASIVFCAFTWEAYVNWLGATLLPDWNTSHERSHLETKLGVLLEKINFSFDAGSRPWQTLAAIVKFRNNVAHGKTEQLIERKTKKVSESSDADTAVFVRSWWESYSTKSNAVRVREDLEKMIVELHSKANLSGESSYPFTHGMQTTDTTFVPKETRPTLKKKGR